MLKKIKMLYKSVFFLFIFRFVPGGSEFRSKNWKTGRITSESFIRTGLLSFLTLYNEHCNAFFRLAHAKLKNLEVTSDLVS